MSNIIISSLILCLYTSLAYGMECTLSNENILAQIASSCPLPFQNSDKSYCCYNLDSNSFYCCDAAEFALKTGFGVILPIAIVAGVIVTLILCCISCLCCSCCPWYRRRRGAVYGKVQTPNVVHVIQTPANIPPSYSSPPVQNHYSPYPTNYEGIPQPTMPSYTNEAYAKQAPYNPNY